MKKRLYDWSKQSVGFAYAASCWMRIVQSEPGLLSDEVRRMILELSVEIGRHALEFDADGGEDLFGGQVASGLASVIIHQPDR